MLSEHLVKKLKELDELLSPFHLASTDFSDMINSVNMINAQRERWLRLILERIIRIEAAAQETLNVVAELRQCYNLPTQSQYLEEVSAEKKRKRYWGELDGAPAIDPTAEYHLNIK